MTFFQNQVATHIRQQRLSRLISLALTGMVGALSPSYLLADAQTQQDEQVEETTKVEMTLPEINVNDTYDQQVPSEQTGEYKIDRSRTATKLNLSVMETPQALSVVTRQQMDDFALTTINDVLDLTPGVMVEKVETDRTYYTARGFDITNFQVDGLTVPQIYGNIQGEVDTATFDRVEVLRGANGLMSSTGNPSATVNFVRKRPTLDFQSYIAATAGSWDRYRFEGDVSGAINEAGTVRGRLVLAADDRNSYLDRYEKQRLVAYGIIEADLTDSTLLTFGHSEQEDKADSPLWGALPVAYSDGTSTDYSRSTSNSADWAYWDNTMRNTFVELSQAFANGWNGIAKVSRMEIESDSKLFYVYGTPDRDTGTGLFSFPSIYELETEQYIADVYASGPFSLAGREHELVVGGQWYKSVVEDSSIYGDTLGTAITEELAFSGDYPVDPFTAPPGGGSDWTDRQTSFYAAARLTLRDDLSLITGGRYVHFRGNGVNYGNSQETGDRKFVPYLGTVYDLNQNLALYASYTEIFQPQTEVDINRDRLAPIEGETYEAGIKAELFDGQAIASLAVFRTQQDNLAIAAGTIPDSVDTFYEGEEGVSSRGVEVDLAGELLPGWHVNAGYTFVDIKDADNERTKTETPRHLLKAATVYEFASMPELKVGTSVKWQDETFGPLVEQDSYAVWDLMASYQVSPQLRATLNINNVLDKKYYSSLYWAGTFGQAFYGAPRHASLTLKYDF